MNNLKEECGVVGVYNVDNASKYIYFGLHSLQHRGQEAAGISLYDDKKINTYKNLGLVTDVFNEDILRQLKGKYGIGHVRYSTTGSNKIENTQPLYFVKKDYEFSICHNGNISNSEILKDKLDQMGSIFNSTSDTEILAHLISLSKKRTFIEKLIDSLNELDGAFSFIILESNKIYAARDKYGLRPLSYASIDNGYIISSEIQTFNLLGAKFIREIKPGEVLEISNNTIKSYMYTSDTKDFMCAMEYIYFSRPDNYIKNISVHKFRFDTGRFLYRQNMIDADVVIGVPDSALSQALGISFESKIKYDIGLLKNRYVGRTFIYPTQELRENAVRLKLSVIKEVVENKRIILVDDSIVRGTTIKRIVKLLKDANAKEIHVFIASPELKHPCFYGVDIKSHEELISNKMSKEELKNFIQCDSLTFLDEKCLYKCSNSKTLCTACFNGKYPSKINNNLGNR